MLVQTHGIDIIPSSSFQPWAYNVNHMERRKVGVNGISLFSVTMFSDLGNILVLEKSLCKSLNSVVDSGRSTVFSLVSSTWVLLLRYRLSPKLRRG